MAKRRKRGRRRGFRGLGALGRGRALHSAVPALAGVVLTGATTLALRAFVRPDPGTLNETIYRWAPGIGTIAGLLGSAALYFMGGTSAAIPSAISAVGAGGFLLGAEALNAATPGGLLAVSGGSSAPAAEAAGVTGLRALMPEFANPRGTGAIVMDQLGDPMGETVSIRGTGMGSAGGFRPGAFGKSPI